MEREITDLTKQLIGNADLKPHQNDTAIGHDLTGWGHHTIIKPSEDQSENDDSDHERTVGDIVTS